MTVRRVAAALVLLAMAHARSFAPRFDDAFDPREPPRAAEWNAAMLDAFGW